ncbi:MAG: PAS domain-containing protein [Acidobacteriia bacterium]|nr:PAS domain-containing protein [Terriglobia bacterium]
MPALLNQKLKESRPLPRIFLWTLLIVFNALLWLLLLLFHWEISLRSREINYFGTQLFPVQPHGVPLWVIYTVCALLTLASATAILRDRSNTAARERIRNLLFQILESLEIGVVVLDDKDLLTMANDAARRLLPEIPPGHGSLDILEVLQSRPQLREIVKAATKQRDYVQEVEHDLGTQGDPWPIRVTTLPLRDPQKRTTGTLLLVHDVREVMRMERQMRTAERLSALGTLAAAMAHEIRNPLEAMNLNLVLLERKLAGLKPSAQEGEQAGRYMKILESEISRLAGIVENFLSFARPSDPPTSEVRLDVIFRQIVDLLANQAQSRKVGLDLSIQGSPVVVGSEDQLKQAFLNLVINSLEAMPRGGALRIRVEPSRQQGSGVAADLAVVRIQDTGVGIPQEQLTRLFDPFFTTRPRGTGLGLTIVHRVIHEHNGRIHVASVPGEGSTFTVELPLLDPANQRKATAHG